MTIQFIAPLTRAIERMRSVLFQPFNLRTWLVLGFTAFLDGMLSGGGGGNGFKNNGHCVDVGQVLSAPYQAREWLVSHPHWMMLLTGIIAAIVAVIVFLLWVTSRGKFMFLDNVVQRRALIGQPWCEYRKEAMSLFWWRLILSLIGIVLIGGTIYHVWQLAYQQWMEYQELMSLLPSFLGWGVFLVLCILALSYFHLLLTNFLVPLMYKNRSTAAQAWDRFSGLHWEYLFSFILYGLFILVLTIVVVMIVIVVGLFTCCAGFVLLAIPYISSVVLLPISYTFRAFSLEFLAQFGDEYRITMV